MKVSYSSLLILSACLHVTGCGDKTDSPGVSSSPAIQGQSVVLEADLWWDPGAGRLFKQALFYPNPYGVLQIYLPAGDLDTSGHPFFEPIGTNGRACVTCHQPADGMSLSLSSIRQQWLTSQGRDPLFAAVDGSNCPDLPQGIESSHSLLLEHGLIRVFRPWPPRNDAGEAITPQFDIDIIRDPSTCNTSVEFGLHSANPTISVFRRPRPAANLKFITAVGFPFEPKDGLPLPRNLETGEQLSGNITADRRVWTLEEQARDALTTHLQYSGEADEQLIQQLVDFEQQVYAAQRLDSSGNDVAALGAEGGPMFLAEADAGVLNSATRLPMWDEFDPWLDDLHLVEEGKTPESFNTLNRAQQEMRLSIARGVRLFRERTFLVQNNAGITDMGFGNPVRNDCNFCHNMTKSGMDVAPGQVDLGTTNEPFADPAPHLPLFKLTCKSGFKPHAHLGPVVYTSDPGFALTTGRCKDIGKITIQNMRGLAARAPFFANGSAENIEAIVDYYERRYRMSLSEQEKQDLTNLMSVL